MKFTQLFRKYWPGGIVFAGTILISLLGFWDDVKVSGKKWFFDTQEGQFFSVASVGMLVGTIEVIRRESKIEDYEKEIEQKKQEVAKLEDNLGKTWSASTLSPILLQTLFKQLDFDAQERISLYKHDQDKRFTIAGRYALNAKYRDKKRPYYPDDQGCLGQAWSNGESEAVNLPDPLTDIDAYVNYSKQEWNIPKEASRKFIMKSRHYFAKSIVGNTNYLKKPIGVIVFESTETSAIESVKIKKIIDSNPIYELLPWIIENYPAALIDAREEGY